MIPIHHPVRDWGKPTPSRHPHTQMHKQCCGATWQVLANLHSKGTRSAANHLAFETVVAALFPDNAKEEGLMRALEALLGVNWTQLDRARSLNSSVKLEEIGAFSATVAAAVARERRKDFRGEGRRLCMQCASALPSI